LARAIERTCRDTGFLVIANHGIDQALIDANLRRGRGVFRPAAEYKMALKVGDLNIGYLPYGAQIVRTSKVHVNTQPNLSESFYIVNDLRRTTRASWRAILCTA
jgi:isopenicillin N synthase-like dioxygenase